MLISNAPLRLRPRCSRSASLRRTLFSLPSLPPLPSFGSRPQTFSEERLFPYKEKELYSIVADVASYPQFIPYCTGSRIDSGALTKAMQEKIVVDAELTVGFMSFTESYVSTVTCIPFQSVQAVASSTTPLFKALSTTWRFQTPPPGTGTQAHCDPSQSTLVTFDLTYEFANPLHAGISSSFFGKVSGMMIQAFEDRCREVYGSRRGI
ncbi:hypothetical protein BDN70DRAFT_873040 [Pholiota conissans]|uniref:Coenzyme Q-binding protein COQ10 START domain-containing protein n=1 Tax=Pholiota conissans TaxID=109636 RepID=A0A9P5Z961_9AGAR|nr:hypothetical protein BDN70DRAFT_873040 [Pholiota conissans]